MIRPLASCPTKREPLSLAAAFSVCRETRFPAAACTNAASRRIGNPLDRVSRDAAAHRAAASPFLIFLKQNLGSLLRCPAPSSADTPPRRSPTAAPTLAPFFRHRRRSQALPFGKGPHAFTGRERENFRKTVSRQPPAQMRPHAASGTPWIGFPATRQPTGLLRLPS